ncbi:MAG: TonB-dependent receptor plug domain-containing protein [Pseudomonadota bacterium]
MKFWNIPFLKSGWTLGRHTIPFQLTASMKVLYWKCYGLKINLLFITISIHLYQSFFFRKNCGFSFLVGYIAREACLTKERSAHLVHKRIIRKKGRASLSAIASIVGLMTTLHALSAEIEPISDQLFDIDIPSQNVADALSRLAEQTGALMLFPYDLARSREAQTVSGRYSIMDALEKLLEGSGLTGGFNYKQVIQITVSEAVETNITQQGLGEPDSQSTTGTGDMQNNNTSTKRGLLASAIAAVFSGAAGNAVLAQDNAAGIEEISITGSRIRQTDGMATPVPVTAITTTELSMFNPGASTVEQLDVLPQFFGTQSSQRNAGGVNTISGGSYLNMRGIGAQRTLILFDGSRVVPGDKRGSVNVDTLPTALMRSVDVVTGGASAAYGADALGGVVNFVLDREFRGLKLETGTGITEQGDGVRWNFSVAGGTQIGDNLNVIGSVQALEIEQMWRDPTKTDWYQGWGHVSNPAYLAGDRTQPRLITMPKVASTEYHPYGMIWARGGTNQNSSTAPLHNFRYNGHVFLPDGSGMRPLIKGDAYAAPNVSGSSKTMSGGADGELYQHALNSAGDGANVVSRSGFGAVRYEFSDSVSAFAQVLIGRSESRSKAVRPGIRLTQGRQHFIQRDNAFLPADVRQAMFEANNGAGIDFFQLWINGGLPQYKDSAAKGNWENYGVHNTYSWSAGVDVVLPNDWDLRLSWQQGEAHKKTGTEKLYRFDRVTLALDAVRHPQTGAIVCNVQLYNPTLAQLAASTAHLLASPGGTAGGGGSIRTTEPLASPVGLDNSIRDCVPWNAFDTQNTPIEVQNYLGTDKVGYSLVKQDFAEILLSGALFEGWSGPISFNDRMVDQELDKLGPVINVPSLGIRGAGPLTTTTSANLHAFSTLPVVIGGYDVWEYFAELNVPIWDSQSGAQSLGGSASYRSSQYSNIDDSIESWKIGLDFEVYQDLRLRLTKSRDVRAWTPSPATVLSRTLPTTTTPTTFPWSPGATRIWYRKKPIPW